MMDIKLNPYERYTLILKHEYVDSDGKAHKLADPLAVQYMVADYLRCPKAILIDEMMHELEAGLLDLIERDGE